MVDFYAGSKVNVSVKCKVLQAEARGYRGPTVVGKIQIVFYRLGSADVEFNGFAIEVPLEYISAVQD